MYEPPTGLTWLAMALTAISIGLLWRFTRAAEAHEKKEETNMTKKSQERNSKLHPNKKRTILQMPYAVLVALYTRRNAGDKKADEYINAYIGNMIPLIKKDPEYVRIALQELVDKSREIMTENVWRADVDSRLAYHWAKKDAEAAQAELARLDDWIKEVS